LCIDRNDYACDVMAAITCVAKLAAYLVSQIVIAGFVAKKLCGIRVKPNRWVGMTGQSSFRVTW
jgi:hypothetical protein